TERLRAARDAFEARRQDLERLRAAADTAAAEYHRVRAATDQLTRWHQLAVTAEGRRQLDGLEEPPAVTYQAPPKPAAPPPPDRPRYTRTVTEERTLLTAPGGRQTYVLSEVDHDGDAFFHALLHGLSGAAPELLAAAGIDAASPDAVPQLRRRLAARLTDPADVDLLAFVTPDETDSFTAREVSDAGLDLGTDTPVRREFEALGVIPHAADLSAEARAGLAVAQLLRRGDAESERGWNHSAADLLPTLAARTFGVRITVVRADGTFDDFDPASARAGRGLEGLIDDAGAPRPHVVLSLAERHYQPARPLGQPTGTEAETALIKAAVPPVGDGDTTARTSTGGDSTSVAPPVPPGGSTRRVDTDGRSFTVRPVPADGDCLFHAVLDSIAAQHPGRPAPGSAAPLPQVRDDLARWYTESADAAALRALHAAQDPVETLVADLFPGLTALQDLLGHDDPPDLTDEQRDRITRQLSHDRRRADLRALAADDQERELLSGFPAAAVAELVPAATADPWETEPDRARSLTRRAQAETLRAEVLSLLRAPAGDARADARADAVWRRIRSSLPPQSRAHIPADRRAFTTTGYGALVARSLASPALWHTPFYDDAPALLAHRMGVRLVLVQPATDGGHTVVDLAPDATGPVVYVHYNGRDHYEALIPAAPAPTGTAPGPRPEREDRPTPPPALTTRDVETRDRLANLLRRHGADEADAARLTAGLSAATLARLRAAAPVVGAPATIVGGSIEPKKATEHTAAPSAPVWSEAGVLTLGGAPLHLHETPGDGDRFTEALIHALRTDLAQLTQGDAELVAALTAPDGPDAVHRWVEQRLATPDAADRAPRLAAPDWLGGRQELSTADLTKAGVALNAEQRVFVELGGTSLPAAEVDLSLPERYRLLRQNGGGGPVTDTLAELLSQDLGVRLTIIQPDGEVRQFGPLSGPAVVLARTDGVYRAATTSTPL
ncbi:MAG: hypothetical protein HOY76_38800, partial [Streptomyces sp.]|nr:hypothetical protein [Streptomyces sp.]